MVPPMRPSASSVAVHIRVRSQATRPIAEELGGTAGAARAEASAGVGTSIGLEGGLGG